MNLTYFWVIFVVLIIIFLVIDFEIFGKNKKELDLKRAWLHSAFWIVLALLFNIFIYFSFGYESALQFFTGYLIEKSLSIDNLSLFLIIFLHFRVSKTHQQMILFWGILGALFFRIGLIFAGIALINQFHWMYDVLGAFLIVSGIHFALQNKEKSVDPSKSLVYRFFRKIFPIERNFESGKFFVKKAGKWKVTMLFIVLLLIETVDILFALDSIPAIFAITKDPFIIYTSNVFAILGLRALYFVVAESISKLYYYKSGLAAILVFVGAKMVLANIVQISVLVSLAVIIIILGITTLFSLMRSSHHSS